MSVFSCIVMKKEAGMTSFESLRPVKKAYKGYKVGHTGTLDRFASGLMVVLAGEATKLNLLFSSFDKKYRARIEFGCETDTLDPEGKVIKTCDYIPSNEEIDCVLKSFTGAQKQVPPVYSAVHVDGKRAYAQARKGKEIQMPERDIVVHSLSCISYEPPFLTVDVHVSKGTYIRSLARDIASALGTAGHLDALERYAVGPFSYADITDIPASDNDTEAVLDKVVKGRVDFANDYLKPLVNGWLNEKGIVSIQEGGSSYYRLYCGDIFLGVVARKETGGWSIVALKDRENL